MIGQMISHYRILQPLSGDTSTEAYLAEDLERHCPVTLRFLSPLLAKNHESIRAFETRSLAFLHRTSPALRARIEEAEGRRFLVLPGDGKEAILQELRKVEAQLVNRLIEKTATTSPKSTSADPSMLGRTIAAGMILGGRYRILSALGRGGMGQVWHAFDLKLQVEVALKALREELVADKEALELLRREVRSARQVVSPNVCRIYDLEVMDEQELLSMEYVDGQTLLDLLQRRGPLNLHEAGRLASQLFAGLQAIHEVELIHRDVKLENIMVTRTGRVVLMDFGIAKGLHGDREELAGTPAYMAPEILRGVPASVRSDIYAAGVVLTEMIGTTEPLNSAARHSLQQVLRADPPRVPGGPWQQVLERAVAHDPQSRFGSVRELTHALEQVTPRVEGAEDKNPYPGLASFTDAEAEFFFGREAEVESLWKKLQRTHLTGILGPSGVGKSSYLQAGLLPAQPEGWTCILFRPGTSPFLSMAQALVPHMQGTPEEMLQLLEIGKPDADLALNAIPLFRRWRQEHGEALLIIDQFEELFTLNPPSVQSRFAEFLGRLVLDADIRLLLSLRDDFLYHCHKHPALAPVFSALTPLASPTGSVLRRALVQPALTCGYRFEDEELVEEMLSHIGEGRGSLPMLAFALAQLWQRRDSTQGLLTRQAYEDLGGVAGALAQHAESVLERLGPESHCVVRELFRNLVTAEGTRVERDLQELLSVFPDPQPAEDILNALVDARLLTSFDVPGRESGEKRRRVEIVHESLLTAWPRLVRWRIQDAEGAQLRDQLRQAAHAWDDRGRSPDLLWTGTAFREFQVWRERYPGGLSRLEDAFAHALVRHAERRSKRRRQLTTAAFVLLIAVTGTITTLWHRSNVARRHSEASKLLALARATVDDNPSAALAYAMASLDFEDDLMVRRFAIETLIQEPMAMALYPRSIEETPFFGLAWSPDGQWLATGYWDGPIAIWSRDGGQPICIQGPRGPVRQLGFSPGSDILVSKTAGEERLRFWSIPSGESLRTIDFEPGTKTMLLENQIILSKRGGAQNELIRLQAFDYETGTSTWLKELRIPQLDHLSIEASGRWLAYSRSSRVYLMHHDSLDALPGRQIAALNSRHEFFLLSPDTRRIATWSVHGARLVEVTTGDTIWSSTLAFDYTPVFDHTGSRLALMTALGKCVVVDMSLGHPQVILPRPPMGGFRQIMSAAFHPSGKWLAINDQSSSSIYPLHGHHPIVLKGHREQVWDVRFTLDGKFLLSTSIDGDLRRWALPGTKGEPSKVLFSKPGALFWMALSSDGQYVAACGRDQTFVFSLSEGPTWNFESGSTPAIWVDSRNRLVAAGGGILDPRKALIHVWNLDTKHQVQTLDLDDGKYFLTLAFLSNKLLLSGGNGGLRLWDVEDGGSRQLLDVSGVRISKSLDSRVVLVITAPTEEQRHTYSLDPRDGSLRFLVPSRAFVNQRGNYYAIDDDEGRWSVGPLKVDPLQFEPPLIVCRPQTDTNGFALHPEGTWFALACKDATVLLARVPSGPPLQILPLEEFQAKLESFTNVRAVPDASSETGYSLEIAAFPGWKTLPKR